MTSPFIFCMSKQMYSGLIYMATNDKMSIFSTNELDKEVFFSSLQMLENFMGRLGFDLKGFSRKSGFGSKTIVYSLYFGVPKGASIYV